MQLKTNTGRGLLCLLAALLFTASCDNTPDLHHVSFEVTIDRDGRTQPVTNGEFRLLKGNLIDLLGGNSKDPSGVNKLSDVSGWMIESTDREARARITQVFEKYSLARATTDSQGKGKFAPVLPGAYYVVGWARVGENQLMIWNHPVEIKKQEDPPTVVLNSSNAATIIPYPRAAARK